eukprot:CAMPEP_0178448314 /NCGR_PEP_ID=MMETSP0689_2-20121128/41915_1 /TAXON_ID=160604 /ORGANISM="Amphidinium massartii, Strain CS-259" /LENGTH=168 /DNA_ID=CAMNT_0020073485 /DNA_START=47 /DNA_END=553 /DNA_ORIENTATION=+
MALEPVTRVFAYGTLRGDFSSTGDRWGVLADTGGTWKKASVRGFKIYQRSDLFYPFAVHSSSNEDVVLGTLLEWPTDEESYAAIARCNRIEGFDPERPDDGMYQRSVVDICLEGGETRKAYIYHQELPAETSGKKIDSFPHGDWLRGRLEGPPSCHEVTVTPENVMMS